MKKVVFFGWYEKSDMNLNISVIENLIARQIQVHFFGIDQFKEVVQDAGAVFHRYMDYDYLFDKVHHLKPKEWDVNTIINMSNNFHKRLIKAYIKIAEYHIDEVKKINPDIIFRDYAAFNGKITASILNKKCVGVNPLIGILNEWVIKNPVKLYSLYNSYDMSKIKGIYESNFYLKIIADYKKIDEELGIPYFNPVSAVDGEDDFNLSFGGRCFQPEGIFNNKKYMCAKPILKNMYDDIEGDEDIKNFFYSKSKLIYLATGSSIRASNYFYNIVMNTVKDTDYKLIVCVPNLSKNYNKPLPENIIIKRKVNQQEILKHADLFITSGGYNSMLESINTLTPMLVNPIINDQTYNAYIIEKLKIGQRFNKDNLTKEKLLNVINDLLNNKKYINNLIKVKNDINSSEDLDIKIDYIMSNI